MAHIPVLLDEVLAMVKAMPGDPRYILDGTFGRGGHARAIMNEFAEAKYVAIDQDLDAVNFAKDNFSNEIAGGRFYILHANFSDTASVSAALTEIVGEQGFDLILLDLGVSSPQLDQSERGFSFYNDGPLDMRMNQNASLSAAEVVNSWSEQELRDLFFELGEIRRPGRVVTAILQQRKNQPFSTTQQLSSLIEKTEGWRKKGHHPATNYFLALRLCVNSELEAVRAALPELIKMLADGGRLMVISFHSLEDRIVKYALRDAKASGLGVLVNKKVIIPSREEQKSNPRSRSAKLRVFERRQTKEGVHG
ncbi:MAG: 16S rRNA (cytosine(1402)-N(4))-methyltransferase RsmH [Pseudobdellovibrionaceae bacterium]|nr:16S rRNA (cytosine(1402)-N(4))-methyltransferase RsmH [Bdellovibrionales bacterium]USN46401.1 MAG: 16S rRNA (cytosine(1402)-N(4))-methyltransferase RsmH [Pseudobdellovibrionaceae bacterium]